MAATLSAVANMERRMMNLENEGPLVKATRFAMNKGRFKLMFL
jgi:hypothetical protein